MTMTTMMTMMMTMMLNVSGKWWVPSASHITCFPQTTFISLTYLAQYISDNDDDDEKDDIMIMMMLKMSLVMISDVGI